MNLKYVVRDVTWSNFFFMCHQWSLKYWHENFVGVISVVFNKSAIERRSIISKIMINIYIIIYRKIYLYKFRFIENN